MRFFAIVLMAVILISELSSDTPGPLHDTTICYTNTECTCNNNNVSCTNFFKVPPFILPDNVTIVHFTDVPIDIFNNTFVNGESLQNIIWVSSNMMSVQALHYNDLKYLDLSKNNISELTDNVFNKCPRLEYVDLSDNQLSTLSDNLFLYTKMLETVKLANNKFHSIPENLFKTTDNIKYLSVGNPNLSTIANNAMANLNKLEYLNIENSAIEYLNRSSFGEHKYLNSILLNNCTHLSSIDNDYFISSAPNIEIIELNNCGMVNCLPYSIVSLKNLKRLQMFDTKIQRNCCNGWFSQWFNETTNVIGYEGNANFIKDMNKLSCPAKIYHTSDSTTLQLTKKGIINCMTYGNPPPAITWLVPGGLTIHKNKEADTNISYHPDAHNWDLNEIVIKSLSIDKHGSLHILRMLRANIGNYTCYVSNKHGNDSKTVEVHLDSEVFFNIKIYALLLGIISALGFLILTILCCAFKLLLIRFVSLLTRFYKIYF